MKNDYSWSLTISHSSAEQNKQNPRFAMRINAARDPHQYGIPQQKKFPLDTRQHVLSAIKFFNYADPVYRRQLATAIIRKIHEYNIRGLTPSNTNKFYQYYTPPKYDKEAIDSRRGWD